MDNIKESIENQRKMINDIEKDVSKVKFQYRFLCELQYKYYSKTSPYQYSFLLNCREDRLEQLKKIYYGDGGTWKYLKSLFRIRNKKMISYAKEIATKFEQKDTLYWLNTL